MNTYQKILLSHETALEYLRALGWRGSIDGQLLPDFPADIGSRRLKPSSGQAYGEGIKPLLTGKLRGLSLPLNILVDDHSFKRDTLLLKSHTWTRPLPERSFMDLGDGIFVSAPELCFMQMAERLSVVELVRLGYELTGSYTLMSKECLRGLYELDRVCVGDDAVISHDVDEMGSAALPSWEQIEEWARARRVVTFCSRPPLVSVSRLRWYVQKASGFRGRKRALRALKYILPDSASPMETVLAMLLCLPCSLGGYGLPLPRMNYQVGACGSPDSFTGKRFYYCDLYWPGQKLDVEYESDMCHTGAGRLAEDSVRRDALKNMGIDVVTITWAQVKSWERMDAVARLIAGILGKRLQRNVDDAAPARVKLRNVLLRSRYA